MPEPCQIYDITLCYEACFSKIMEVAAENLSEACTFAMAHADDGAEWKDTLASSRHWIESVDQEANLVPDMHSAEAIRCGGAELAAHRLHDALSALVRVCERGSKLSELHSEVERAKSVLRDVRI